MLKRLGDNTTPYSGLASFYNPLGVPHPDLVGSVFEKCVNKVHNTSLATGTLIALM